MINVNDGQVKRFAIWTSGGDASGMDTVTNGVHAECQKRGIILIGVHNGVMGLVGDTLLAQTILRPGDWEWQQGTSLGSIKGEREFTKQQYKNARRHIETYGIDGIIVVGGNGSMAKTQEFLAEAGIYDMPVIVVPKTIDNDAPKFDADNIGFASAAKFGGTFLRNTDGSCQSMGATIHVVRIMGQKYGSLAYEAVKQSRFERDMYGAADIVLTPEVLYNRESLFTAVHAALKTSEWRTGIQRKGLGSATIVIAEGIPDADGMFRESKVSNQMIRSDDMQKYVMDLLKTEFPDYAIKDPEPSYTLRGATLCGRDHDVAFAAGEYAVAQLDTNPNLYSEPHMILHGYLPSDPMSIISLTEVNGAKRTHITPAQAKAIGNEYGFVLGNEPPDEIIEFFARRGARCPVSGLGELPPPRVRLARSAPELLAIA